MSITIEHLKNFVKPFSGFGVIADEPERLFQFNKFRYKMKESIKKEKVPFTQISNELLNDKTLSSKAKGIYCFMFSKPEDWNFTINSMSKQLMEGTRSISGALNELKEKGWVSYIKNHNGSGEYTLHLLPKLQNATLDDPKLHFADVQNANMPKRKRINNIDYINNIDFNKLLNFLNEKTGKKARVVSKKVKSAFGRLLKEGYLKEDIVNAINNASKNDYHVENNYQYLNIEFFSRSSTIDKYGYNNQKGSLKKQTNSTSDQIPVG